MRAANPDRGPAALNGTTNLAMSTQPEEEFTS